MFCMKSIRNIEFSPRKSEDEMTLNNSILSQSSASGAFSPIQNQFSSFSRVLSFSSPQSVDKSHHSLEKVPVDLFRISNAQMKELNLSSNNLKSLPTNFYNLSRLQKLDLSNNEIVRLSSEIEHFTQLETFNVSRRIIYWRKPCMDCHSRSR